MDGMKNRIVIQFGTPGANASAVIQLNAPVTLQEVSACASNNSDATLTVGTTTDPDGYITSFTIGDSDVPVVKDRGDFDGALVSDTDECPHIADDTLINVVLDYDGASGTAGQNVTVVLTVTEG